MAGSRASATSRPTSGHRYAPVFFAFRLMVAIGLAMLGIVALGWWLRRRGRLFETDWFLRLCQWSAPLGFLAVLAGWTVTEVGRQPWTVYGALRTANSVSPSLTGPDVVWSLLAYMIVYLAMYPAGYCSDRAHGAAGLHRCRGARSRAIAALQPKTPFATPAE